MFLRKHWVLGAALLALTAVPALVGCDFLPYQFCIFNGTSYVLKELNIVQADSASWGPNDLADGAPLAPGADQDIKGFGAGSYWVRAIFDVVDPLVNDFCNSPGKSFQTVNQGANEVLVYSYDLDPITTANLCIDYEERSIGNGQKLPTCLEIYAAAHFEI
jgi:hypothetical protein